jgi:outer membrane protein OmpA-like peptidoglycan-associated protein
MRTAIHRIGLLALLGLAACVSAPQPVAGTEAAVSPAITDYVGAEVAALPADDASGYMQHLQQALVAALSGTALNPKPDVRIINDDLLLFSLPTASSFEVNSGELRPEALATYGAIAEVLRQYDHAVIHVLAFASEPADADLTLSLPGRQAAAVAAYWIAQGIPASRLRQSTSIADAASSAMKSAGQLVIAVKPVVQGHENQAWIPPSLPMTH